MNEGGWEDVEPLLPSQFFGSSRTNEYANLILAVLYQAIDDWRGYGVLDSGTGIGYGSARRRKLRAEAGRWLFDDDSDGLFSFSHVCGVLGIEGSYLRGGLRHFHGRLERRPNVLTERRRSPIRPRRVRARRAVFVPVLVGDGGFGNYDRARGGGLSEGPSDYDLSAGQGG